MIFALLDLTTYLSQRRHYSDGVLLSLGAVLSREDLNVQMQDGEVFTFFLHPRRRVSSWVIMYLTSSRWSHTGTLFHDGSIVDATTAGVIRHTIDDYLDGTTYVAIQGIGPLSPANKQALLEFGENQVGKAYNWGGVRRLGRNIILGSSIHWRPRITLDIALLAAVIVLASGFNPLLVKGVLVAASAYTIIVSTNLWWIHCRPYVPETRDMSPEYLWIVLSERNSRSGAHDT